MPCRRCSDHRSPPSDPRRMRHTPRHCLAASGTRRTARPTFSRLGYFVPLDVLVGPVEIPQIARDFCVGEILVRSEEHTSELQSLMRISYAVFCLKKKNKTP